MARKTKNTFSFDTAYQELEQILESLQSDQSLDGLEAKIIQAKDLILACKSKLRELDNIVEKTINPES